MFSYLNASVETIRRAVPLYLKALPGFLVPALGLFAVSASLTAFAEENAVLLLPVGLLISTVAAAFVYAGLLRCQYPSLSVRLSAQSMLHFIIAYVVVIILMGLGLVLLIIPGLWIAMATLLVPIFVLAKGQSALDAIASSSRAMKGSMLASFCTLVIVSLPVILGEYMISTCEQDGMVFVISLLQSVTTTFVSAVIVVIFAEIHPDHVTSADVADNRIDA